MSLIFGGDVAIPFETKINTTAINDLFVGKTGVFNLEGAVLFTPDEVKCNRWEDKYSLYNTPYAIDLLLSLNARVLSIMNNHTRDFKFDLDRTTQYLTQRGLTIIGNRNHDSAELTIDGIKHLFVTFATFGCVHAHKLFNQKLLLKDIKLYRSKNPNARIVIFPHWGLELCTIPEPADRILAHRLIDAGADIIVGHHPHVIQPIEKYKGKYIVYSVGNFIMPNSQVAGKKFKPRPITQVMLLVEWNGDKPRFHKIHFDPEQNIFSIEADQNIETMQPTSKDAYLKQYIKRTGLSHYLRFARYGSTHLGERERWLRMKLYYMFRRALIKIKIYRPY